MRSDTIKWLPSTILGVALLAAGTPAPAKSALEPCPAPFGKLLSADAFKKYPARSANYVRPTQPKFEGSYRTAIRRGAKAGPNFAGHYTIIEPGCGTATVCPSIVDALTGKVYGPTDFHAATALSDYVDAGTKFIDALNYKRDSRLLIVAGDLDDDVKRLGLTYYVWESGKLSLLRFVPMSKVCRLR